MNKQAAWERKDHYELAVVPAALTGESVAKAAQHDSDSGPNPGSTYASNNGKCASTHRTPPFLGGNALAYEVAAFCAHVSASKICRSSHSPSPATCRKPLANWMASSLEFARRMANPPTTSLASVKGPSVTVTFPFELRTRAPKAVGRQPSVASSQPAFMPSSTSLPILAISSCEGGTFLSTVL